MTTITPNTASAENTTMNITIILASSERLSDPTNTLIGTTDVVVTLEDKNDQMLRSRAAIPEPLVAIDMGLIMLKNSISRMSGLLGLIPFLNTYKDQIILMLSWFVTVCGEAWRRQCTKRTQVAYLSKDTFELGNHCRSSSVQGSPDWTSNRTPFWAHFCILSILARGVMNVWCL